MGARESPDCQTKLARGFKVLGGSGGSNVYNPPSARSSDRKQRRKNVVSSGEEDFESPPVKRNRLEAGKRGSSSAFYSHRPEVIELDDDDDDNARNPKANLMSKGKEKRCVYDEDENWSPQTSKKLKAKQGLYAKKSTPKTKRDSYSKNLKLSGKTTSRVVVNDGIFKGHKSMEWRSLKVEFGLESDCDDGRVCFRRPVENSAFARDRQESVCCPAENASSNVSRNDSSNALVQRGPVSSQKEKNSYEELELKATDSREWGGRGIDRSSNERENSDEEIQKRIANAGIATGENVGYREAAGGFVCDSQEDDDMELNIVGDGASRGSDSVCSFSRDCEELHSVFDSVSSSEGAKVQSAARKWKELQSRFVPRPSSVKDVKKQSSPVSRAISMDKMAVDCEQSTVPEKEFHVSKECNGLQEDIHNIEEISSPVGSDELLNFTLTDKEKEKECLESFSNLNRIKEVRALMRRHREAQKENEISDALMFSSEQDIVLEDFSHSDAGDSDIMDTTGYNPSVRSKKFGDFAKSPVRMKGRRSPSPLKFGEMYRAEEALPLNSQRANCSDKDDDIEVGDESGFGSDASTHEKNDGFDIPRNEEPCLCPFCHKPLDSFENHLAEEHINECERQKENRSNGKVSNIRKKCRAEIFLY